MRDGSDSSLATEPFLPLSARRRSAIESWLATTITQPSPELGREGAVCPFVAGSLRRRRMVALDYRWAGDDRSAEEVAEAITNGCERFAEWTDGNALDTLMITFGPPTGRPGRSSTRHTPWRRTARSRPP